MRRTLLVLLTAAVAGLGGCGGDDKPKAGSSTSQQPESSEPDATTTEVAATTTVAEPESYEFDFDPATDVFPTQAEARKYELEAPSVEDPAEGDEPICGDTSVAEAVPGYAAVGATYENDLGTYGLNPELWGWADSGDAEAAFQVTRDNVACADGASPEEGVTVELSEVDLGQTYGDESLAYAGTLTNEGQGVDLVLVAMRVDNLLLRISFYSFEGTESPDARILIESMAERLIAASA